MPQVILYSENCQGKAGRSVPMPRDGEIDIESPDYHVWEGTPEELVAQALELIDRQSGSSYHARCGHSILESLNRKVVYVCRNDSGHFVNGVDDDGEPTFDEELVNAEQHETRQEADRYAVDNLTVERHVVAA